jgi:Tfp pilus assembly protein PilV
MVALQKTNGRIRSKRRDVTIPKRAARGVNLIETMLALLIMTIVMIGTSMMHARGRQLVVSQEYYQKAAQLATQKLEEIKAMKYDNIAAGDVQEEVTVDGLSYQILKHIALTATATTELPKPCKEATVTIRWTLGARQRERHEATFTTYIGP